MTSYHRIVELARREAEAVEAGEWEALEAIEEERRALTADLPASPPAAAAEPLSEALEIVERTTRRLAASLGDVRDELARLDRGRRAARGYTGARPPAPRLEARG